MHRGADGIWYAYAQWPSAQPRTDAFAFGSLDPDAEEQVRDAILESFPEIVLEPVVDHLVSFDWSST